MIALATTRLREFWPDHEPLTFLGRWCLYEPADKGGAPSPHRIAPYPWDDRQRFLRAAEYIDQLGERLLPDLAAALNAHHRLDKPVRYWRIVVGPWLAWFLEALYDRYCCLRDVLDADPDVRTIGLADESFILATDMERFVAYYADDFYNLQLYTRVLADLGVPLPRRPLAPLPPPSELADGLGRPPLQMRAQRMARRAEESLARGARVAVIGAAIWRADYRRLGMRTFGAIAGCDTLQGPDVSARPSSSARRALSDALSNGPEFERIAGRAVGAEIPVAYLEAFRPATIRSGRVPRAILSATGWVMDESFKRFAAEAQGHGARLLAMQHGGYYGMLAAHSPERHELRVSDTYYSAGWPKGLVSDRAVTRMPLPTLLPRRAKPQPRDQSASPIVLVTTMHPRYLYRLQSHPVGPQWAQYMDWEHRFVSALPDALRRRLIIRLYSNDYGWRTEQVWRTMFPDVTLQRASPPMREVLDRAALVVIDHPATTLLEAMAADVPQVLFWDPNLFSMRASAAPALSALRKARVLHHRPEDAAAMVARVADAPGRWWESDQVRAATSRFRAEYAWASSRWAVRWRRELLRQASEAR